jgi:hypothetical protein
MDQREKLKGVLPDWRLVDAPENHSWSDQGKPLPTDLDVIIVFSRTHQEKHTMELAQTIRRLRTYEHVPLLVAITIYQMPLGHDVEKLPKANFIFKPIHRADLEHRLQELNPAAWTSQP